MTLYVYGMLRQTVEPSSEGQGETVTLLWWTWIIGYYYYYGYHGELMPPDGTDAQLSGWNVFTRTCRPEAKDSWEMVAEVTGMNTWSMYHELDRRRTPGAEPRGTGRLDLPGCAGLDPGQKRSGPM